MRIVIRTRNLKRSPSMSIFISYRSKLCRNKHLVSLMFLKSPRESQETSWFSWKLVCINPCCRNLHSLCKICLHFFTGLPIKNFDWSICSVFDYKRKMWNLIYCKCKREKVSSKILENLTCQLRERDGGIDEQQFEVVQVRFCVTDVGGLALFFL